MGQFLGQIFTLLTNPPSSLVYHLLLVFSIAGALVGAIQSLHSSNFPQERRTVIGLCILLGLQLALFIISGFAGQKLPVSQVLFPPLDRAVTLLTLVWIIWIWAFPERVRMADVATLILTFLGLVIFGLTLAMWAPKASNSFNHSIYETGWQALSLAVVLLGILMLLLRRPNGWTFGFAMLVLGFTGHLASLVYPQDGSLPGAVRLAQIAMFPILLTLPQRFPYPRLVQAAENKPGKPGEPVREGSRRGTDPEAFQALMSLAAEPDSSKVGPALVRGIAQAMLADMCFLVFAGKDKPLSITSGYDLIHEKELDGATLDLGSVPLLANAIQRGRPLRLPSSNTSVDLKNLGQALGLENPGSLLSVPISSAKHGSLGSVLMLSPYSNRLWNAEDQIYLSNVTPLLIPILERSQRTAAMESERDRSLKEAHNVMERATEARKKYEQMAVELEGQRGKMTQSQLQTIMQEEAQDTIEQLRAENYRLRHATGSDGGGSDQLERELRQALEENAHMQDALADANVKILELEKRPSQPGATEKAENKSQLFDLNLIIDNAMASTRGQIREKNITLRLDLTSAATSIRTDRDALQQILIDLLQNAAAATPNEGNITLRVQVQDEGGGHLLLLRVTDGGGGIAAKDLARVFAPRTSAEQLPIPGLGDTGGGLSNTRLQVEAQNGHIWVETEAGKGSTFNVLMPVVAESLAEKPK